MYSNGDTAALGYIIMASTSGLLCFELSLMMEQNESSIKRFGQARNLELMYRAGPLTEEHTCHSLHT